MKPDSFGFRVNLGYNLTVYIGKKIRKLLETQSRFYPGDWAAARETGRFIPYPGDSRIIREGWHKCTYRLLAELEVSTASYGPSFLLSVTDITAWEYELIIYK